MSYNSKSIIKDVNDKPVPQYWNEETQQYEVIKSSDGRLRVIMVDKNGEQIQSQDLVNQIATKINELVFYVKLDKETSQKLVDEVASKIDELIGVVS